MLPTSAPAAPPLQQLQTKDLQLVWFHPQEDYLAPYAARAFENSMRWQQRTWGWTPDGKTNVLIKDFNDFGNAGARSTPNNALIIDIAPFSYSFETFVSSERIFSLMNHELVHVANMDQRPGRTRVGDVRSGARYRWTRSIRKRCFIAS